mmetsp:Transcript_26145/g.102496  ORF Transcript_26145/g.102496 Transcript_26145/m.102496 type:complete len:198 (-) Transcript_26145:1521-2114(-)
MSGQVSITIKNVTDRSGPSAFEVQMMAHSTIGELKKALEKGFPGGPAVSSQRLISTGRVLSDNLVLENALSKQTPPYTIHLVVVEKKTKPGTGTTVKGLSSVSPAPAKIPEVSTDDSSSTPRTSVTAAKVGYPYGQIGSRSSLSLNFPTRLYSYALLFCDPSARTVPCRWTRCKDRHPLLLMWHPNQSRRLAFPLPT